MAAGSFGLGGMPIGGEHYRRRPFRHVEAIQFTIEDHDRFTLGIVERLAARKPRNAGQVTAGS